jgi:hypothetical protein
VLLVGASFAPALAQDKGKEFDIEEFRRLRRLDTPLDFWNAVQFEIDLGKPDIAARYLRGLLAKKPSDKDLQAILDKDGITRILALRNVPQWSTDKKVEGQARKDVEELVNLATEANRKRLADASRIRELIGQLQGTPEEKTYAIRELYKAGAPAVPYFFEAYQKAAEPKDRQAAIQGLQRMGPATLAPLEAALDTANPALKLDILDTLRRRHVGSGRDIVPFLWYVSASPTEPEAVRKKATQLLADFLDLPASKLTPAKVALTREAERYYNHEVTFGDPRAVPIWRWEGKNLVQGWPGSPTVTQSQAEEYYGLKFARQALTLDPDYRPAQLIALSIAVDKAMEKAGPTSPLSRVSPAVSELLAKASPELVIDMLDKAMKDKRTNVVLAAVRSLGDRAETRAKRPSKSGDPALVRALYYPDPRVQLAAAAALVNIPGPPAAKTASRVVEVLARAVAPATTYREGRKILVALADEDMRDRVGQYVREIGAYPIVVTNGRDAMRKLRADPAIEAVLLDSTLPYPGLANLLAQMRQDVDVSKVPIILAAVPETRSAHDAAVRYRRLKGRVEAIHRDTRRYRELLAGIDEQEAEEKKEVERDYARERRPNLEERAAAYRRVEEKYAAKRADARHDHPKDVALLAEIPRLEKEMAREIDHYDLESQARESALERYVQGYDNIQVVHASAMVDPRSLETTVLANVRDAGNPGADELRESADRAIEILANLTEGKPEGYDIRPAASAILNALKAGRLSPEGQLAAIRAATRLDGAAAQTTLSEIVADGGRNINLRLAAAKALIVNVQRQGARLPGTDLAALQRLSAQAGLDPRLKEQIDNLFGALRPSERSTGERLRDYHPTPAGPLAPPKEKEEKKEKE